MWGFGDVDLQRAWWNGGVHTGVCSHQNRLLYPPAYMWVGLGVGQAGPGHDTCWQTRQGHNTSQFTVVLVPSLEPAGLS